MIKKTGFIVENVHDDVAVIDDRPAPVVHPFRARRLHAVLLGKFLFDVFPQRADLRGARSAGQHEIIAKHGLVPHINGHNIPAPPVRKRLTCRHCQFFACDFCHNPSPYFFFLFPDGNKTGASPPGRLSVFYCMRCPFFLSGFYSGFLFFRNRYVDSVSG